jgi:hypothetical protein
MAVSAMSKGKVPKNAKRRWWPFGKRTEALPPKAIAYDPSAIRTGVVDPARQITGLTGHDQHPRNHP